MALIICHSCTCNESRWCHHSWFSASRNFISISSLCFFPRKPNHWARQQIMFEATTCLLVLFSLWEHRLQSSNQYLIKYVNSFFFSSSMNAPTPQASRWSSPQLNYVSCFSTVIFIHMLLWQHRLTAAKRSLILFSWLLAWFHPIWSFHFNKKGIFCKRCERPS